MIGASAGAAAMLAPSSASAGASSPAGAAHDPATAAATADPSRSGAARAPAGRAQASAANHEDAGASADNDFASLLQTGITDEPAAAAAPAAPPAEPLAGGTADAALPDQLLAMLGGAWTPSPTPAAAAAEPQAAPGAHGPVFPGSAAGASPMPASTLARVAEAPGRVAGPADTAMAASAMEIASVTKASGAEDAMSHTDNGPNAPAFVVPAPPPAAQAAAARAMSATPLAVPTDPQAGFDEGFGARLVWMAEQRLGHAEIRLNPEHLGPIEVRVEVDGTEVRAEFQSQHAAVRQAIEASMPRLREMLGQQGLQLGQADVGQRQAGSGQPQRDGGDNGAQGSAMRTASQGTVTPVRSRGLLDEYA